MNRETYFRYSDGGTSLRNTEIMIVVHVRLSKIELRKNATKPICNFNTNWSNSTYRDLGEKCNVRKFW